MHIETTEKERGGGEWCKKRERARERAGGERVQDKESERRASQTKEKSVTHRERGGQGKKALKNENQQKKKGREGKKKPAFSLGVGGVRRRGSRGEGGRRERERKKRYGEKKRERQQRRRRRVSGLGVIKPGVSSLQRHVRRLNQVDASRPHFHITPWPPA